MNYKLTDNHFEKLSYFDPDIYEEFNNIYNVDDDILIKRFDKKLVINVLDYYINYDDSFITKENYIEVFEIFFHFGSEIGILFCYHNGIVYKELNKLKSIDPKCEENIYDNYCYVVKFNTKIYNKLNREMYQKYFDLIFNLFNFNLNILDYNKYAFKEINISNLNELQLLEHFNNKKLFRIYINFNQEIKENVLPKSSTHLYFCRTFNQEIKENVLPNSLKELYFGVKFNQEIKKNILPTSLIHLTFGDCFNQEIKENVLPISLTHLTFDFGSYFNQEIKENILPNSLTHLTFGIFFNQKIEKNVLPNSLQYLTFGWDFNQKIEKDVLPNSLKYLKFGYRFNQEIKQHVLPNNLTHLTFGNSFNQEIKENILPIKLKHLTFGIYFNQEIKENILPIKLKHLTFGECFNQEIKKNVLPNSLSYIKIKKGLLHENYLQNPNLTIEYYYKN